MERLPSFEQFRVEEARDGLIHFVFDCPGRTMNVFSEAAIVDLGRFADWLPNADVRGVVLRSGKESAFCAGADLAELGSAYDMIMAAPPRARFNLAFDHFFRLSRAIRALETSGKPVAAAIGGLALGGGCELALGTHYRVLADDPKIGLGLPESLVGLLPGSGGTQRLPRLIGIDAALPILLDGARLGGAEALATGLVDILVEPGSEVAAAEAWLLGTPTATQPWDRDDWLPADSCDVGNRLAPVREKSLIETLGHYPAPLAIIDCIQLGLPQSIEGAIRSEMAIFAELIQREEPRNMIQTLFLGKTAYDRLNRREALPQFVAEGVALAREAIGQLHDNPAAASLGFAGHAHDEPVRRHTQAGYWADRSASHAAILSDISAAVAPLAVGRTAEELRIADYAIVRETGYPAYLGGPFAFHARGLPDGGGQGGVS